MVKKGKYLYIESVKISRKGEYGINNIIQKIYMDISNMKNIIVLKNLPSNLIDEAIVVLKSNRKIKKLEYSENKQDNFKNLKNEKEQTSQKDYIIKEAELVVSDYISKIENQNIRSKNNIKDLEKKYKKLKYFTIVLTIMLTVISFIYII